MPHTLSDDGDPLDVVVANTRPIVPGAGDAAEAKRMITEAIARARRAQ